MNGSTDPNCLFCKIVAGEIPSERIYESETLLAFKEAAEREAAKERKT